MRSSTDFLLKVFEAAHEKKNRIIAGLLVLSLLVFAGVFWQLRYTGITMANATICGVEAHTHNDECGVEYVTIDSADLEQAAAQSEVYILSEEGYTVVSDAAAEALSPQYDAYYQVSYVCGEEEHIHSDECYAYSNDTADVEDASVWDATLPAELSGDWEEDLVAIAVSQIGYAESVSNFRQDDSGERVGYTRYGQWYNNLYGKWDTMFVLFCLHYTGVSEETVPYAPGADSWIAKLTEVELYQPASGELASGNIVFFDTDGDGDANRTGIVEAVNEDGTVTIIEGDCYAGTEAADNVARNTYLIDDAAIIGRCVLPEQPVEIVEEEPATSAGVMLMAEGLTSDAEQSVSAVSTDEDVNAASTTTATDFTSYVTSVTYAQVDENGNLITKYEPSTDSYIVNDFTINFSISKTDVLAASRLFTYPLPDGVFVTDDLLNGGPYVGRDNNYTHAFNYSFVKTTDADGNVSYSIEIEFLETYINDVPDSSSDLVGHIIFDARAGGDLQQDSGENAGDIIIDLPGNTTDIIIDKDVIVYDDNSTDGSSSTRHYDVTISKTGVYNSTTQTIDYTITITSEKGTPTENQIVLTDTLDANGVSVSGEITNIFVQKRYFPTEEASWNKDSYALTDITDQCTFNTNDEGKLFSATLPQIVDTSDTENRYTTEYLVTYSVNIADLSENTSYQPQNSVTLENVDDVYGEDINASQSATVNVSKDSLAKSASLDSATGKVKWEITLNNSNDNIVGSQLQDAMFADIVSYTTDEETGAVTFTGTENISITPSAGYTWVLDSNGHPAIDFVETETGTGSNTNSYTIIYYSDVVSGWTGSSASNTATFDPNIGNGNTGDQVSVNADYNTTGNNLTKSFVSASTPDANGLVNISWQTVVNVPEGGIPAGTVIKDSIKGAWNVEYNLHYMTYEQVKAFIDSHSSVSTETSASAFTDYDLHFYGYGPADNYYTQMLYWYDSASDKWYTQNIYSGAAAEEMSAPPTDVHFIEYQMIFNSEMSGAEHSPGTFTLSYSTTANTADVTSEQTYNNIVSSDNNNSEDVYTYKLKVIKSDGNGSSADSSNPSTDGLVYWQVKINLPSDYTANTPITVTDTLPAGVTLTSVKMNSWNSATWDTSTVATGSTLDFATNNQWSNHPSTTGTYTKNDTTNTVSFTISDASVFTDGCIYVYYTCMIDDVASGSYVDDQQFELQNTVSVKIDDTEYDSDSQKQTITMDIPTEEPDEPVVTWPNPKRGTFDSSSQLANYVVDINPEAAIVNDGNTLTITDTLTYNYYPFGTDNEYYQKATLLRNTVKLYYAQRDENGDLIYVDANGNQVTSDTGYLVADTSRPVDVSEWSWTYNVTEDVYLNVTSVISAEVPDGEAMVLQYSYYVDTKENTSYGNHHVKLGNTYTAANGDSYSSNIQQYFVESSTSGGIISDLTYSFYKVDENNYQNALPGAQFTLYKYDSSVGDYVDTGKVYTTDSNGQFSVKWQSSTSSDDYQFAYNTAYYVVETKAPDGYILPDDIPKYYFYFSHDNTETYPEVMPPTGFDGSALNLTESSHTVFAQNAKNATEVIIDKTWLDTAGEDVTATKSGSIDVTLYQIASSQAPGETGSGETGGESGGEGETTPDDGMVEFALSLKNQQYSTTTHSHSVRVAPGTTVQMTMYLAKSDNWWGMPPSVTLSTTGEAITVTENLETVSDTQYIYSYPFETLTLNQDTTISGYVDNNTITEMLFVTEAPTQEYLLENMGKAVIYLNITEPVTETTTTTTTTTAQPTTPSIIVGNVGADYTIVEYDTYTLSAENGWTLTLDTLPAIGYDENGDTIYYSYYVTEETLVNYDTTYDNINSDGVITGIANGSISIVNKSTGEYALVETGSIGTLMLTVNGLLFMTVPLMYLFKRRENCCGEQD